MTCLLCFELNFDSISLMSIEGKQHRLSELLHKYFRIFFDKIPNEGNLCRNCWRKLYEFHEFYVEIESIYEKMNKIETTTLTVTVKQEKFDEITDQFERPIAQDFKPICSEDTNSDFEDASQVCMVAVQPDDDKKSMPELVEKEQKSKCVKTFTKKSSKRKRYMKCTIRHCAEEFFTKDELNAHKIAVHKRIQCTYCPDTKLVLDVNAHLKNMHGIIQKTICEHCGQIFQNNTTYLSHVKGIHEVHEPLQCDICQDWFKSRDSLRSHMTYVHIQGPQTCSICGKISTNRKSLLKHQLIHIESRKDRYKCIVCGRGFRDNTKLKEHSYIHSGVTDAYECNFCGKNFRFGSSLSAHRMKVHPVEMAECKNRLQWKRNAEFKIEK